MKPSATPLKTCSVCQHQYEPGRSECPECRTPNRLFESPTFIKFAVEIEKALYRAAEQAMKKEGRKSVQEFVISAIEEKVSRLNTRRRA